MRQEITDEIACDLRTELDNSRKENLRHSLLNEIEKCNSNVIFYGYQGGGHPFWTPWAPPLYECWWLCWHQNQKIFKLGLPKGKTKKFAPVLVTFGDQAQRNNILKAGSRLPEGVSMERDIPRAYRETYSKFKKHAWRLRAFYGVKTKIIFVSHVLTLRYK